MEVPSPSEWMAKGGFDNDGQRLVKYWCETRMEILEAVKKKAPHGTEIFDRYRGTQAGVLRHIAEASRENFSTHGLNGAKSQVLVKTSIFDLDFSRLPETMTSAAGIYKVPIYVQSMDLKDYEPSGLGAEVLGFSARTYCCKALMDNNTTTIKTLRELDIQPSTRISRLLAVLVLILHDFTFNNCISTAESFEKLLMIPVHFVLIQEAHCEAKLSKAG
jgi:hypothetical protein